MTKDELTRHIYEQYHIVPDHPFTRYSKHSVFRHDNGKWFCLLMSISGNKLGLADDKMVDIINIKVRPEFVGSLLTMPEFLPAYHMNKEHWVSVLIHNINDDELKNFIDDSFHLTR